jgi:uncharacterized protein (TIGR03437 family)
MACFAQPNRIASRIDNSHTVVLPGRVHPLANARNDAGTVESGFPLSLTLLLKPSADQQSGLDQLIQGQQNASSLSFHQWLTPEQYAGRFGWSASDAGQIAAWLQSQGFTVDQMARSRTFIMFIGTAGQVQNAFGTSIHRYLVNGELHYANAGDPRIPAALAGLVAGIRGLNDFRLQPQLRKTALPQMTVGPGVHQIAPDDFATIYDIAPLYTAGTNGLGQSVAVVGQSALYGGGSDITAFWKKFNLTSATLVQKLVGRSPGVIQGDVDESSLDIEWAGAVARNSTVVFVYSNDIWTSAMYAVDQNVAPVLSMSYGICEMYDLADLPTYRALVQQANAEGVTWVAASGDNGAAGCDGGAFVAEAGLAVQFPASIPEVTAMGGTMFNEGSGSYWNTANTANDASAKSYIPEVAWNETNAFNGLAAGGGGASLYFPQPAWQTTGGVPNDGWRHVPDISFSSSFNHDGYYVYSQGSAGYVGGTSAATPTMAGVVALLNQYLVSNGVQSQPGLGNINPTLYRLAQTAPSAFHDVTGGDNIVPCVPGSPDCVNGSLGYSAGPGYDSATGLGSVDVANLIRQWSSQPAAGSLVVPSIDHNPVFETAGYGNGNGWTFNLTLTEEAGIGTTLTDFTINGASHASQIASLFGTAAIAPRGSISASYGLSLTTVPQNVTFGFSGMDASGAAWSTALTVPFTGPQTQLAANSSLASGTCNACSNAATGQRVFAPGMIMSVYGTGMGSFAQAVGTIPLPEFMAGFEAFVNGVQAPLYYVSPNQVNLQIPYETSPGTADLTLGNPWDSMDYYFTVSAAGPGIFTFPDGSVNPSQTGSAGQQVSMYITGEGQVRPSLADGTTPAPGTPLASLPKPRQSYSVTVGGIAATVDFIGIPSGLVGVTQINFTIPANLPSGAQPVVVTVGTASSPPAYIAIQ